MFVLTHSQYIRKPNESYAIGTVPSLNQKSESIVKWDTSARSCSIVGSHEKITNRRNDIDMTKGHHKKKVY